MSKGTKNFSSAYIKITKMQENHRKNFQNTLFSILVRFEHIIVKNLPFSLFFSQKMKY